MPLISIIVPIYRVETYLKRCIDSLINQTYKNIEVILVDDGSPDGCPQICDEYAEKDKRIKVIHKVNGGLSSARKAGVDKVTGDYGMFVDADDWLDYNTIQYCVDIIKKNLCDCILFSYTKEYSNHSIPICIYDRSFYAGSEELVHKVYRRIWGLYGDDLKHPELQHSIETCWGKVYKKELLCKGKYFDTNVVGSSEDALFNIYALKECKSFYYLNMPLYHYWHGNEHSLSASYRPNFQSQWNDLFNTIIRASMELNQSDDITQAINNRIALSIVDVGLNEMCNPIKVEIKSKIRQYLYNEQYHVACKNMQFRSLPTLWKIFICFAKNRCTLFTYLVLKKAHRR